MSPKFIRRVLALIIVVAVAYFVVIRQGGRRPEHERRQLPEQPPSGHMRGEQGAGAPEVRCESRYFAAWTEPGNSGCTVRVRNGYPVPDPRCTPGGVNPTVTEDVLRNPEWRTREVRNCAESEAQKHAAYGWYAIRKPRINSNENQVCELDHLVPLELGGADGMGNIWPECGPNGVTLNQRYFKQKDHVENYLAEEVKAGQMSLADAQKGIAKDWTQYLNDADLWCGRTGRC